MVFECFLYLGRLHCCIYTVCVSLSRGSCTRANFFNSHMELIRQLKKPGLPHEAGLSHCWFRTVIMSQQQHQQHPVIHYTSESSWAMVKSLFFYWTGLILVLLKDVFFCLGRRQVFALCQRGISQTDYFSRGTCGWLCLHAHTLSHTHLFLSLSRSLSHLWLCCCCCCCW